MWIPAFLPVILLLIASGTLAFFHTGSIKFRSRCVVKTYLDINDKNLQDYLKGPDGKPWKGSRSTLQRRGQIPLPEYSPRDVVTICLKALQNNDEPQLDHGACVVLEFKSPDGPLASGLDPAAYGRFLRDTPEYSAIIDFKGVDMVGELEEISAASVRQQVKVSGWSLAGQGASYFDFYLTRVDDKWLVDVILARK